MEKIMVDNFENSTKYPSKELFGGDKSSYETLMKFCKADEHTMPSFVYGEFNSVIIEVFS